MYNFYNELKVYSTKRELVYDKKIGNYREKHVIKVVNPSTKVSKYFTFTSQCVDYISDGDNLLKDALHCIYSDYCSHYYHNDVLDFIENFGYDHKEGIKVYKAIERSSERFEQLINDNILELLEKEFEEY